MRHGRTVNGQTFSTTQCYLKALEIDPNVMYAWFRLGNQGGATVNGQSISKKQCYIKTLETRPWRSSPNTTMPGTTWELDGEERSTARTFLKKAVLHQGLGDRSPIQVCLEQPGHSRRRNGQRPDLFCKAVLHQGLGDRSQLQVCLEQPGN